MKRRKLYPPKMVPCDRDDCSHDYMEPKGTDDDGAWIWTCACPHEPEPYGDGHWARCKLCGEDGFPVSEEAAYGLDIDGPTREALQGRIDRALELLAGCNADTGAECPGCQAKGALLGAVGEATD